jgi:hypothetical protein
MAVCLYCSGEMKDEISCRADPVLIGDVLYEPIRWGDERESRVRRKVIDFPCGDCSTPPGGVHHPGCDLEQCPACRGQALMCGCFDDPGDEHWDDDPAFPEGRPGHSGRTTDRCTAHRQPQHYRT